MWTWGTCMRFIITQNCSLQINWFIIDHDWKWLHIIYEIIEYFVPIISSHMHRWLEKRDMEPTQLHRILMNQNNDNILILFYVNFENSFRIIFSENFRRAFSKKKKTQKTTLVHQFLSSSSKIGSRFLVSLNKLA